MIAYFLFMIGIVCLLSLVVDGVMALMSIYDIDHKQDFQWNGQTFVDEYGTTIYKYLDDIDIVYPVSKYLEDLCEKM